MEIATRVAALRGSPIASFGSSDLVRRDAAGRLRWLMQADEEDRELFGALSGEALMAVALACTGEADFRRRIRERRGPSPDLSW